jgi:hypothetical protein
MTTQLLHTIYPSLDALLDRDTLAAIEGRAVLGVRRAPFRTADALSGARFERIETTGADGTTRRYVLKRLALELDWIMRATEDVSCRAITAWTSGLLDRLPATIAHNYVAVARDGGEWAILLHEVADGLVPPGDAPISAADHATFLDHLAQMHAALWDEPAWADPLHGFCTLRQRYQELAPVTAVREAARGGDDPIPPIIGAGWALLPQVVAPEVAAIVARLLDDPAPLCDALAALPQTVCHGDWKFGNLGLVDDASGGRRTALLDWAVVGMAPPAIDLAWYLAVNSARLPIGKEATIEAYRDQLAGYLGSRFDLAWWQPQLDLALLGGFLQLGWPKAYGAVHGDAATQEREQAELAWWSRAVLAGAARLGDR